MPRNAPAQDRGRAALAKAARPQHQHHRAAGDNDMPREKRAPFNVLFNETEAAMLTAMADRLGVSRGQLLV